MTGIIWNLKLANSGFHAQINFSENYLQFGHIPSKMFTSPIPCWNSSKNVDLKGHQITSLSRVHTCLGPNLTSAHPNLAHTCCIFNKFGYQAVVSSSALMVQLDRSQANRFEWDGKRNANSWQIQIWKQTAVAYASVGQHEALKESIYDPQLPEQFQ